MSRKISVAVLFGGRSGEHAVSLMSARSVLKTLDPAKYQVIEIGISPAGAWFTGDNAVDTLEGGTVDKLTPVMLLPEPRSGQIYIFKDRSWQPQAIVDVFFPVLHGTFGEDGTLQGLFEMADVAYVGCGVLASSVGMDKSLFKDVMRANNIPVVESLLFSRDQVSSNLRRTISEVEGTLSYPVFVKPANLGSSVGISKCSSGGDLLEGLMEAARYDRRVLVERGVNAREIEVSVLGNEDPVASLPGEILPADEFYSYDAKYMDEDSTLIIPAPLDDETTRKIQAIAVKVYRAIDGAGMARVDFLLDKVTGELFVSEVNTIPGFTSISMYPKLWAASGISYMELVDRLIDLAIQRKQVRDATERSYRRSE